MALKDGQSMFEIVAEAVVQRDCNAARISAARVGLDQVGDGYEPPPGRLEACDEPVEEIRCDREDPVRVEGSRLRRTDMVQRDGKARRVLR